MYNGSLFIKMASWKEKISYKDMVKFCSTWKTLKEVSTHFGISPMQTHNAVKWFVKFKDDFVLNKDIDPKVFYIKSTESALKEFS